MGQCLSFPFMSTACLVSLELLELALSLRIRSFTMFWPSRFSLKALETFERMDNLTIIVTSFTGDDEQHEIRRGNALTDLPGSQEDNAKLVSVQHLSLIVLLPRSLLESGYSRQFFEVLKMAKDGRFCICTQEKMCSVKMQKSLVFDLTVAHCCGWTKFNCLFHKEMAYPILIAVPNLRILEMTSYRPEILEEINRTNFHKNLEGVKLTSSYKEFAHFPELLDLDPDLPLTLLDLTTPTTLPQDFDLGDPLGKNVTTLLEKFGETLEKVRLHVPFLETMMVIEFPQVMPKLKTFEFLWSHNVAAFTKILLPEFDADSGPSRFPKLETLVLICMTGADRLRPEVYQEALGNLYAPFFRGEQPWPLLTTLSIDYPESLDSFEPDHDILVNRENQIGHELFQTIARLCPAVQDERLAYYYRT